MEVFFLFEDELRLEPGEIILSMKNVLILLMGLANDRWLNVDTAGCDSWMGVLSVDVEINLA